MPQTHIFLVRHAESKYNPCQIYNGIPRNDKGLSRKGKSQVRKLVKRLKKEKIKIDVIYSSDFPRCLETAKTIAKAMKKKPVLDKNFREPFWGKFELMPQKEIEKKFPKLAKDWFYGDVSKVEVGEGFNHAYKRVWREFEKVVKKNKGKTSLIITHQAPIKFIVCKLFGGLKYFNNFVAQNASLTLIRKDKKYKLRYLNDISHLK
ncbi:MAG: hypothetical protein DRM99_01235 [Thermoplasmata archaeon]|nr:MAG: hypothetical protein DRM99_01235 [Thermoplasmata archaeon]